MITQDKRLASGVAAAVLVAALGGFGVARWTSHPAVPEAATEAKTDAAPNAAQADSVAITADAIRQSGIKTEVVGAGGLAAEIVSSAIVHPAPTGEALVTARAGGTVTRVFKRLGDPVRAGETLAIVVSRDAAQIAADRTAASAKAVLAQKNLARERYLFDQKVSARVDYEQAQAEAAAAHAEARRAQVAAGAANVTRDGSGVAVVSPISGKITAQNANLGAFVQSDTELFRVADPRQIQIEAAILPADVARIAAGDRAIVELPSGGTLQARVRSVTPTLSGETRQATAVLDVSGGEVQPGLAVRVRLLPKGGAASSAIVVPDEALQTVDGKDAVFVRTPQGFKAHFVTIGQRSAGRVEVLRGLSAGQSIATAQAFLLKAELGKSAGEEE